MQRISDAEQNKTQQVQTVGKSRSRAAGKKGESLPVDLFKQFSEILDQIASQLAEDQELSAEVAPRPRVEAPREKVQEPIKVKGKEVARAQNDDKNEDSAARVDAKDEGDRECEDKEAAPESTETSDDEGSGAAVATVESEAAVVNVPVQQSAQKVDALSLEDGEKGDQAEEAPVGEGAPEQLPLPGQDVSAEVEKVSEEGAAALKVQNLKEGHVSKAAKATQGEQLSEDAPLSEEIQQILEKKAGEAQIAPQNGLNRAENNQGKNSPAQDPNALPLFVNLDASRGETRNLVRDLVLQNALQHPKQILEGVVAKNGAATNALSNLQNLTATGPGFFKQTEGSGKGSEQSEAKALPRVLALRTLEKVESALKEVARSKDGKTISVRLDPPELGTVKIDVSFREGNLHARIVAESAQVNTMLREKSHELQGLLRRIGLDADKVSVSVGSEQGAFGQQSQAGEGNGSGSFSQQRSFSDMLGSGDGAAVESAQSAAVNTLDHWVA
jgi:flagellar hook-length control protein FliK